MAFTLEFRMAIRGRLEEYGDAVARANTSAIRTATNRLKNEGRKQIVGALLSKRLANALRGTVTGSGGQDITKRGVDPNPLGRVFSNALVKRQGGTVDLINVFETGTVVIPKHGQFIAVPTKLAGGRRARPMSSYPPGTFRVFFPKRARRGSGRLNAPQMIAVHKARKEVWYILFRSVQIRSRLRLEPLYRRIGAQIPALQDRAWQRQVQRLERSL